MTWGRKRTKTNPKEESTGGTALLRAAHAVCVIGALACVLFLCSAVGKSENTVSYPREGAEAAVAAFLTEHASFSDALGISEYYPLPAVRAGSFSTRGEEAYRAFLTETQTPWTFWDYLKDAFRTLLEVP